MYSFPIMKTKRLLLYREIINAINKNHKEPTNTLRAEYRVLDLRNSFKSY
jgi:hypothetical protein